MVNMRKLNINVVIADDTPLILDGLKCALNSISTINVVASCESAAELFSTLSDVNCDVIVTNYSIRGGESGDGLSYISRLRRLHPNAKIVVLTRYKQPAIIKSVLALGVSAIVGRHDDATEVITAIHVSASGGEYISPRVRLALACLQSSIDRSQPLSARETEVMRLYISGLTVGEIAVLLKKGKQTISCQKMSAMRKLGIKSNVDLIKYGNDISHSQH
ncbi:response regulator transcription factor [Cupriavidus basilensis]|uniref:response regulator transcription factor n=1 Tax=Cupriavidus basilensis TaxID=68895 RepID=UPI00283F3302|nr:response regulator transcription factor [Cupriavidus basilensis]MDR3383503.1 response regulator transcription factor [Cupriavidus basilensis]